MRMYTGSSSSDEDLRKATLQNGSVSPGWLCRYYKKFDQYWNVFPKTDYTYSPSSRYNGKQVAPGVPIIPNLSRRSILQRGGASSPSSSTSSRYSSSSTERYTAAASSSSTATSARRDHFVRMKLNCNLSNSEEILQNIHNSKRRSRWQRARDVWTSVWWKVYTIVVVTMQTCTTVVTTTTTTIASTTKGVANSRITRLFLLPFLFLLLIYLFRDNLVSAWNGKRWSIAERENENGCRDVSYLLSPLYSVYNAAIWALSLVTRSIVMIPTLFDQLASLLWSFLVLLWPSHVLGLLMNATSAEIKSSVPVMDYSGSHHIVMPAGDLHISQNQVTMEEIRKMVMEVLQEQERRKTDLLNAVDERIRSSQQKLTDRMKEMAEQLREEENVKASDLELSLRHRVDEAKREMANLEKLVNAKVRDGLEEQEVRGVDNWKREIVEALETSGERWKAEIEEVVKKRLAEETEEKAKQFVTVSVLSDLTESSKLQTSNTLDHQRNEWKTILEKLEMRLDEVEKSNIKKEELDSRLADLRSSALEEIQNQIHRLESDSLARGITSAASTGGNGEIKTSSEVSNNSETTLQRAEVQSLIIKYVEKVLAKYHADRTGLPDYALQSSGATIVSIRCTNTYPIGGQEYRFGIPWGSAKLTSPDAILKPGVSPGDCWAFVGSQGYVIIKLAVRIKVTSFTMEHMPKQLALQGHIKSAPKDFSVWGLNDENDENPVSLGSFTFLDNGESLQQFKAREYTTEDGGFDMVELRITSNHGHLDYTCLYRFRVHGIPIHGVS